MRRIAIVVAFAALALAGCAAGPAAEPVREASSEPVPVELTIQDFCGAVSELASVVMNADVGYLRYGVSAEDWAGRHDRARELAARLVGTFETDFHVTAERLQDAIEAAGGPPIGDEPSNFAPVQRIVHQLNNGTGGCIDSGAEVRFLMEWGG